MVQGTTKAHGGTLVNRITNINTAGLYSITITNDLANDVENIADGIFSPLEGFLGRQDFESVVSRGRLENDLAWTIPITLDVDGSTGSKMKESGDVLLRNPHVMQSRCCMLRIYFHLTKRRLPKACTAPLTHLTREWPEPWP